MKRFLLFTLLIAAASSACKKSKKVDLITPETLLGTWGQSEVSNPLPITYIFRADSTFTKHSGGVVGTHKGTFKTEQTDSTGKKILLQAIYTIHTTPPKTYIDTLRIKIISSNQMEITTMGGGSSKYFRGSGN